MSEPAVKAFDLPFELVYEDGIPMDDHRHVLQMHLLMQMVHQLMAERGRSDYFTAGNIFVYHSIEQARDVAMGLPYFQGPDFFLVNGVPKPEEERKAWVAWEEGGRLPDLIVELLSPSTVEMDRTDKKDLYAQVYRAREYYLYDMDAVELEGFRLAADRYRPIRPDRQRRLRSEVLGLDLGLWHGVQDKQKATWIRFYHPDGRLAPTVAEAERQRAEAAEAEVVRLRALLLERSGSR
jgi:Uma2 family endonuclease